MPAKPSIHRGRISIPQMWLAVVISKGLVTRFLTACLHPSRGVTSDGVMPWCAWVTKSSGTLTLTPTKLLALAIILSPESKKAVQRPPTLSTRLFFSPHPWTVLSLNPPPNHPRLVVGSSSSSNRSILALCPSRHQSDLIVILG